MKEKKTPISTAKKSPAKKVVAKKVAKKVIKKVAPKVAAKATPKVAPKAAPKKVVAKKVATKKVTVAKKVIAKPVAKKAVAPKAAPKKVVAKKVAAKKVVVAKKVIAKPVAKKVVAPKASPKAAPEKVIAKPVAKKVAAPVKAPKAVEAKKKIIPQVVVVKEVVVPKQEPLPECVSLAANILFQLRAEQVQLIDLRGINDVADFYLIGTCTSEAQMQTILNELTKEYKAKQIVTNGVEYKSGVQWAVLDAGLDLMVHLFEQTKREEIGLDILYRTGKVSMLNEKDFITKPEEKKAEESNDFI